MKDEGKGRENEREKKKALNIDGVHLTYIMY